MLQQLVRRIGFAALGAALLAASFLAPPVLASADGGDAGVVYTLSNASAGNQVLVFQRAVNGVTQRRRLVCHGRPGDGRRPGFEGALLVTGRWIIAVNAGSNDVSVLARDGGQSSRASARAAPCPSA